MIIQMLKNGNTRAGSHSCVGTLERMKKVGITNTHIEGIFLYFEVEDYTQLNRFKERFKIYSGYKTAMIETRNQRVITLMTS